MRHRAFLLALTPGLAIFAAACSFAPRYKVPETVATPAAYQEIGDWKQAAPVDAAPRGAWWTLFGDPALNALQEKAVLGNQDLKAGFARLQQARADVRAARADLFPTITAGPTVTRERQSLNGPRYSPGTRPTGNDFVLEADLSYELDLWGRISNSLRAARRGAQASAADVATLELSLHAELASTYFLLRSADAQQQLLDRTVEDYTRALTLTRNLYQGGAAALADVAQAQAQLENARTQAAETRFRRAQLTHAIAALVGASVSSFQLEARPLALDVVPPGVDPGLPSALLERRPDVAAAERRVAAANAEIGVARAAYFPVFRLGAGAGYDSKSASTWIEAPSHIWSLGASALLTMFDAGRHRALSDRARAAYDEAVASYRGTVLNAYRDVEDNIAALRQLELESVSEAAAVAATQTALEQARYRYKGGVVTYLEVVSAENAALQAQLSARDIQVRRFNATVFLIKALGGGWQNTQMAQLNAGGGP